MDLPSPKLSSVTSPSPSSSSDDRHSSLSSSCLVVESLDPKTDKPRELHKVTERRRREKMKEYVQGMAPLIPEYVEKDEKMDKLSVMKLAVDHIRSLNKGFGSNEELAVGGLLSAFDERSLLLKASRGVCIELNCSNFEVINVSESIKDLLGLSQDEFQGHFMTDFLHQEDRLRVQEHLKPPSMQTLLEAECMWRGERKKKGPPSSSRSKAAQQDTVPPSLPADVQRSFYCRLLKSDLLARPHSPESLKSGLKLSSNLQLPQSYAFCKVSGYFRVQLSNKSQDITSLLTATDSVQEQSAACQGCHFVALVTASPLVPTLSNEVMSYHGESDPRSFCARVDTSGTYTYIDKRFWRIVGVDPKKMIKQSGYVLFHKEDIPGVLDFHQRTLVSHCEGVCPPFRMRTAFGYWQWMQARVSVITNPLTEEIEHFVINAYHVVNMPHIPIKAEPPVHEARQLPSVDHCVDGQRKRIKLQAIADSGSSTSTLVNRHTSSCGQAAPWQQTGFTGTADVSTKTFSGQFLSTSACNGFQGKSDSMEDDVKPVYHSSLCLASPQQPPLGMASETETIHPESLPADLFQSLQRSLRSDTSYGQRSSGQPSPRQPPPRQQQQQSSGNESSLDHPAQALLIQQLQGQSLPGQQSVLDSMQAKPSPVELSHRHAAAQHPSLLQSMVSQPTVFEPSPRQKNFGQSTVEQARPLHSSLGQALIDVGNSLLQAMSVPQQHHSDNVDHYESLRKAQPESSSADSALSELLQLRLSGSSQSQASDIASKKRYLSSTQEGLPSLQMMSSTQPESFPPSHHSALMAPLFTDVSSPSTTDRQPQGFLVPRTLDSFSSTSPMPAVDHSLFQGNPVNDSSHLTADPHHGKFPAKHLNDFYPPTMSVECQSFPPDSLGSGTSTAQKLVTQHTTVANTLCSPVKETPNLTSWETPTSLPSADQAELAMILQLVTGGHS